VICLDEMGPDSAKSHAGSRVIRPDPTGERRVRAIQEIDYGRRGSGYVFGAFCPATGEAVTAPYPGRTIANWVDFLDRVDGWVDAETERVYAILDNLSTHRALDVLLWALEHPRWEFVFQPTYAAYLNLIEPWWKVLRSLALKGRRFASWDEITLAIERATAYWNAHRHPFVWGRRKRRRAARRAGLTQLPLAA
jgi:transposase